MSSDVSPGQTGLEAIERLVLRLREIQNASEAFNSIAECAREIAGSDTAYLLVSERGTRSAVVMGYAGQVTPATEPSRLTFREGFHVFPTKSSRSVAKMFPTLESMPEDARQFAVQSGVAMAIISSIPLRGEVLGYVAACNRQGSQPFHPDAEQALTRLADNVAFAFDNVRSSLLLRRNIEETERLLSLAPIGLLSTDPKGIIRALNKQMVRVFGMEREDELLGTSVFEMPAVNRSGLDALIMQGMEGHAVERADLHFVPAQDKAYYLHAKVTSVRGESGEIESVLTVAMDTTSKVRLENQLERSYEKLTQTYQELERVNRMKSQFIDVVSHELRTPLTVMRGYVDLMESDYGSKMDSKFHQRLMTIKANTDKLYTLVESMLDMSRLEKGSLQIHPEPVRIDLLLDEVVKARLGEAIEKKQTMTLDIEGTFSLVMADRRRIRDVFSNLIDNAIKYTQEGGKIQVGGRDEGKILHLWVKDNGVGIPLENLGRLFDKFYIVASNDLAHQVNRIGLSLPISKGIVEAHGGKLWVESQVGKGSVFHVDLPKELPK